MQDPVSINIYGELCQVVLGLESHGKGKRKWVANGECGGVMVSGHGNSYKEAKDDWECSAKMAND